MAIVFVACSNQPGDTAQVPLQTVAIETRGNISQVDRIAYVSPSGDLFTVDPDGGGLSQLTGGLQAGQGPERSSQAQPLRLNEFYAWPTWSAAGTKLAASRVIADDGGTKITLEVLDARTGRSESVYENGQQAGLVAEGAPHYVYWGPTGDALSFLASITDGLGLFVWDGTSGKPASLVDQGPPLYYQWHSDSDTMALHIGTGVTLANPLAGTPPQPVVQSAVGFRVPAISPDGRSLAYVAAVGEDMGLYVTPINDLGQARKIIDIGVNSAFLWSPDGNILLVGDQSNPRVPFFNRLMLVPLDNGPVTTLATDGVLAFYWAPTGEKIAWAEVNPEQQEMEWVVSPIRRGVYHA